LQQLKCREFDSCDRDLLDKATRLRAVVWNHHVGREIFRHDRWRDHHDCHAFHWGVFNHEDRLIASARLCIHDSIEDFPDYSPRNSFDCKFFSPIAMMNRLVVHPAYQNRGAAKLLDTVRINKAIERGCSDIVVEVPFYRKLQLEELGFSFVGKTVDVTNIKEAKIQFYLYRKSLCPCLEQVSGRGKHSI